MKNRITFTNNNKEPQAPDELLKITALLYFKEALIKQEYEQCPALIAAAKRFGAKQVDIWQVIAEYRGTERPGRPNEADAKIGGRLRFIEEE